MRQSNRIPSAWQLNRDIIIEISDNNWHKINMMRLLKTSLLLTLVFYLNTAHAQTIVKMDLPAQSDEPLSVVTLFDEAMPEGIPVVLGLMGFDVEGGMDPYQYAWVLNGEVISTEDILVFTPMSGDELVLEVTDQNNCTATTTINLLTGDLPRQQVAEADQIRIFPTVFRDAFTITYPDAQYSRAHVRIFNLRGALVDEEMISVSGSLSPDLPPGMYFVSVKAGTLQKVEKITAL